MNDNILSFTLTFLVKKKNENKNKNVQAQNILHCTTIFQNKLHFI